LGNIKAYKTRNKTIHNSRYTQLPGRGVAYVGSFAYLVGDPTSERSEAATAHTGGR
jgi:hypothetical protein